MNTRDNMRKCSKLRDVCLAKMIAALVDGPCTADELVDVSGLAKATVYAYMRAMRKEGAVYISGWESDRMGRDAHMIYKLGRGTDKPRRTKTHRENNQAYKARKSMSNLANVFRRPAQPMEAR